MYDENLKACLIRLVQNLKDNKKYNRKNITLFLGAGCSLSSTKKDITTNGIIRDIVEKYSVDGEKVPDKWQEIYEKFTNNVWNGLGNVDRINLLENYFLNMQPSTGYKIIRFLLEEKYIDNIITTNFDMMLDEVLEGLSYNLQVGCKEKIIGDNPQFTLLKAHGDLKMGELRFIPPELYKLPEEIENIIKKLTSGIVIIAGYRGQDMGIIQALNTSSDHCAYWITFHKPDRYNAYENDPVFNWLKKRNSDTNLLYGSEYGDFDTVLEKISKMLKNKNEINGNVFYAPWKKCYINDYLSLNLRLQNMFIDILKILHKILKEYSWQSCSIYYADSHEKLICATINLLNDKIIPEEILYGIENELESLFFALSLEIWSMCQGYRISNVNLVDLLQKQYEKQNSSPLVNDSFWEGVKWLSGLTATENINYPVQYCEILVYFDKKQNFETILKKVSLESFSRLFTIIQRLLIFSNTCGETNEIIVPTAKKNIEQHVYQILAYDNKIDIKLNSISKDIYQNIFQQILNEYFAEQIIASRHILYYDNIFVNVDVKESTLTCILGIVDELEKMSQEYTEEFIGNYDVHNFVECQTSCIIEKFLKSENSGLWILGESGIGKTTVLKGTISGLSTEEYIVIPVSAKNVIIQKNFMLNAFDEKLIDKDRLIDINSMLGQRKRKLLLMIDAINEINAPINKIIAIYKEILEYCDFLSNSKLRNIQLIITCRSELYEQLQYNIHLCPSPSSFFSTVNQYGEDTPFYTMPYLTKEEAKKILENYSSKTEQLYNKFNKKFGYIIHIPFYLEMICKMILKTNLETFATDEYVIYQIWYDNICRMADAEYISKDCINEILNYIIYYKYFCDDTELLTSSHLFVKVKCDNEILIKTYEWMLNHSVIKQSTENYSKIYFLHDKFEEFFLTQYMLHKYDKNLLKAFKQITTTLQKSSPVTNSIYMAMKILNNTDYNLFEDNIISVITSDNEVLSTIIADMLLESEKNFSFDLYIILKDVESFVCKSALENFIKLLFIRINEKIDAYNYFDICAVENMNNYIHKSNVGNSIELLAFNYYSFAKYILVFPISEDKYSYEFAIELCIKFNELDIKLLPEKLVDQNNQLLATFLRHKGKLNESVALMEKVYNNLYKNACYDDSCKALLELGATYRELTLFDKALQLYNNFDSTLLLSESLKYRLYMNIGIIYKNKVQNLLFNHQNNNQDMCSNYEKAKKNFEKVYDFAKKSNDIPLLLEILAELIECSVVGYNLNLETINTAVNYGLEMNEILPQYNVPIRKIQYYRMWARIYNLQGQNLKAIENLRQGFQIAVHYNIPFRAADCCNQISGILCDNLNNSYITPDMIQEGIEACEYSINYYQQLNCPTHVYLQDSKKKLKKLQKALENIS